MQTIALVLPLGATVALGAALLVPLRDDTPGRRITPDGTGPLCTDFRAVTLAQASPAIHLHNTPAHTPQRPVMSQTAQQRLFPWQALTSLRRRCRRLRDTVMRAVRPCAASSLRTPKTHRESGGERTVQRSFETELDALFGIAQGVQSLAPTVSSARAEKLGEPSGDPARETGPNAHQLRVTPTGLPPRRFAADVSWWSAPLGVFSFAERRSLLERIDRDEVKIDCGVLVAAYQQEDVEGRTLALRALARHFPVEAHDTFAQALSVGTDEERVAAVDALAASGRRDALATALRDCVDAIAARAALAYVGTTARKDYVSALGKRVEAARLNAILALLAGIVE